MALTTFLWTSCSDDELYRSNEQGSRLEEMGDFKLSSFTLEKGIWEIADTIQQIKIHLKSHTDDSIRAYDAAVLHSESNPSYSIYIPKTDEIPDSDYDLTAFPEAKVSWPNNHSALRFWTRSILLNYVV